MKSEKASRAIAHLDDDLIMSALDETDTRGENADLVVGGRKNMKNKKIVWRSIASIAAVFVVAIFAGYIISRVALGGAGITVALDVNPSIEIEVDKNERIDEVRALNAEAKAVLGDMKLEGEELEVAMNKIIASMLENGYLSTDQNSILLSVDADDQNRSNSIKAKIQEKISLLFKDKNIDISVIMQDFHNDKANGERAEKNDISPAKAALISKIVDAELLDAKGVPYTYEALAKLKVNELKLILESRGLTVGGIEASGKASGSKYITRDRALEIAVADAGVAAGDILRRESEIDFDDDHGVMVYEVEFVVGELEYEYEVDAVSEKILEKEIGADDKKEEREEVSSAPDGSISREAALEIACRDAGVAADAVRRPKIEVDLERGVYVYEVEFKHGDREYEYTINASSGDIIERESEPIDD